MRVLGFGDAMRTGPGADKGIDVTDGNIVAAQVKHLGTSVGAPDVQRLVGAAQFAERLLFYSASGYSRQAINYAQSAGVALFRYTPYGDAAAQNEAAEELLAVGANDLFPDESSEIEENETFATSQHLAVRLAAREERGELLAAEEEHDMLVFVVRAIFDTVARHDFDFAVDEALNELVLDKPRLQELGYSCLTDARNLAHEIVSYCRSHQARAWAAWLFELEGWFSRSYSCLVLGEELAAADPWDGRRDVLARTYDRDALGADLLIDAWLHRDQVPPLAIDDVVASLACTAYAPDTETTTTPTVDEASHYYDTVRTARLRFPTSSDSQPNHLPKVSQVWVLKAFFESGILALTPAQVVEVLRESEGSRYRHGQARVAL